MATTSCCACHYLGLGPVSEATAAAPSSASGRRAQRTVSGAFQLSAGGSRHFVVNAVPASRLGHSFAVSAAGCGALGRKEHLGSGSLRLLEHRSADGGDYAGCPVLKVEAAKRVNTGRRFALSSTLIVTKGNEEQATALCKDILNWGAAKTTQKGSGVTAFDCNMDPFESNTYHFWELYDTFQVMNDVRSSPEHTKFMDDVRPLLEQPVGLAAYEYKDGQIGHMLNPIGPKGEGGLDDATGQSGTKQQSAVIGQGLGEMEEDIGSKAWGLEKLLAKVRGESKDGGWSFKSLFGDKAQN